MTDMEKSLWERLPPEIREIIFDMVRDDHASRGERYFAHGDGMPPLISALRHRCLKAYKQALAWVAEEKSHMLYMDRLDTSSMRLAELSLIKNVRILLKVNNTQLTRSSRLRDKFVEATMLLKNIQHVQFSPFGYFKAYLCWPEDMIRLITEWPFWLVAFKALKTVEVDIPRLKNQVFSSEEENSLTEDLKSRISDKLGVLVRCTTSNTPWLGSWDGDPYIGTLKKSGPFQSASRIRGWKDRYMQELRHWVDVTAQIETWTWEAMGGTTMDMSQDLGWEWDFSSLLSSGESALAEQRLVQLANRQRDLDEGYTDDEENHSDFAGSELELESEWEE
jgi:hypothetical protein